MVNKFFGRFLALFWKDAPKPAVAALAPPLAPVDVNEQFPKFAPPERDEVCSSARCVAIWHQLYFSTTSQVDRKSRHQSITLAWTASTWWMWAGT